jgi:hypothetical protein
MNRARRNPSASTSSLLTAALLAAGILAGCADNRTEPNPALSSSGNGQEAPSQADLLEAMAPALSLIEEGLFADATETSLAGSSPSSQEAVASPIQPRRFWRHITDVRRSYEFAFADSDSVGRPTTAIVTIHKRFAGTFNIVPEPENEGDPRTVIRKELRDHWVRRVKLRRIARLDDTRYGDRWRVAAVSGVKVTSRGASSEIASVHVAAGVLDTTITGPLAFFNLRRILRFDEGAEVTLTVTTTRSDDVVLLYRSGHREKMTNNGDNTYTATFPAGDLEGWRHFGVNALSQGTLYDDELPYDSNAWILPYVIASTPEVDYLP